MCQPKCECCKYSENLMVTDYGDAFRSDTELQPCKSELHPDWAVACRGGLDRDPDKGDWFAGCACLLLVVTSPRAAVLVIAPSAQG
jgi:hypothetical protein